MRLTFLTHYKSIHALPASEIPDFTIITGENGAGKTHFLEAITEGLIRVEGIEKGQIEHHNWTTLAPQEEGALDSRTIEEERSRLARAFGPPLAHLSREASNQVRDTGISSAANLSVPEVAQEVRTGSRGLFSPHEKERLRVILDQFSQALEGVVGESDRPILKSIASRLQLPLIALTEDVLFEHYPLTTRRISPLRGTVTRLFVAYAYAQLRNDLAELRNRRGENDSFLTVEQFQQRYGPPPWEVVNQVFTEGKLPLRINRPPFDTSREYAPRLFHESADVEIGFSDLSSGERILVSVALFLFFSQDIRQPTSMPALILLDEVDAPLHPSMALSLLRTIERVMVGKYERKVILATHSPSTVALAPEDAVYAMDAPSRKLRKVSRDEAIRSLTVGVPLLSINWDNRRQVFVESKHDATFYERIAIVAQPFLHPEISMSFIPSGHSTEGGCDRVRTLVGSLTDAGSPRVFGIIDWDLKNDSVGNVLVLGSGKRYSIENFIFDPILIAALLLRDKLVPRENLGLLPGETYADLRSLDKNRLQSVADSILTLLGITLTEPKVVCSYANGSSVQLPEEFLRRRGHDLEDQLKNRFEGLRKYHKEDQLKLEILDKILDDVPGLLPSDFVELLRAMQQP